MKIKVRELIRYVLIKENEKIIKTIVKVRMD